ncbi:MAG: hypothetical protein Q7T07_21110 [Burkholderiaceae bacterium]|nr:hypothetical protein [Burkholderiaceae bacterium]
MSGSTSVDKGLLFKLIKNSTSIAVVSDFLKKRDLPHSAGSWDDMFRLRLEPALAESKISIPDLVDLLRNVEEYGYQHIFLFHTNPAIAQSAMDRPTVTAALASLGLSRLLTEPDLFDMPTTPAISDVRWVVDTIDTEIVIKEIQVKERYELSNEIFSSNGMIREYKKIQDRGVNIARLKRNGDLEIRIASRSGSNSYSSDLSNFRNRIKNILPLSGFAEKSLSTAKDTLWNNRALYSGKIRFSEVAARNDDDYILKATGGNLESNVSSNVASVTSMESFIGMDGKCESYNLWFSKAHTPSKRDVHVLLSGEVNEFAINAHCTQSDYEYVIAELRSLNA